MTYYDPRARADDRAPSLRDIIAMSGQLTWDDARALAMFDQPAMDHYAAGATIKLGRLQAALIRDLVTIAAEGSASRDQNAILGVCVADNEQRAMLWRVCRRRFWERAVTTMVCFALTSAAGLPYLTPQLRRMLTPIPMAEATR